MRSSLLFFNTKFVFIVIFDRCWGLKFKVPTYAVSYLYLGLIHLTGFYYESTFRHEYLPSIFMNDVKLFEEFYYKTTLNLVYILKLAEKHTHIFVNSWEKTHNSRIVEILSILFLHINSKWKCGKGALINVTLVDYGTQQIVHGMLKNCF